MTRSLYPRLALRPRAATKAPERAEVLRPVFDELVGLSHRAAAKALNARGSKTATGKAWTAVQVTRARERLGLVPRKRRPAVRLSEYKIPVIDPGDRNGVAVHDLVRAVLADFDEVAMLSEAARKQLNADLDFVIYARLAGLKVGKPGVSNEVTANQVYMVDLACALERADLPVKRWRRDDRREVESFYFRLARELADAFNILLPKDLQLLTRSARQHIHPGEMSPRMKRMQRAMLSARRRRH